MGDYNSNWQGIFDRIRNGQYDFTFGPNSPDPTTEDLNTVFGAGGRLHDGNYAVPRKIYYSLTPAQRDAYGIRDIAPNWHGNRLERFFGPAGSDRPTGGNNLNGYMDFNGGNYGNLPISNLSDRPAGNQFDVRIGDEPGALGTGGFPSSGGNPTQMAPYDPNFNYGSPGAPGSGGPTQKWMGVLGSVLGGAAGSLIPGGGIFGAKLGGLAAKSLTKAFQNHNANQPPDTGGAPGQPQGNKFDLGNFNPFGGLPSGFNEQRNPQGAYGAPVFTGPGDFGPNFTGDSIFGGRTNLAMALPGSFGPGLGAGSAGDMGAGDYFGNESMKRLLQGGDATLGFGMTGNNTFLPPNQWGGVGAGGNTQGGSKVSGGTITQRRMSNV